MVEILNECELKNTMFYGATPEIFENAEELRNRQTPAEKKLWEHLYKNQLGVKFRRQHPISCYIVDFYCHQFKLVIEIDGVYHNNKEQLVQDLLRTEELEQFGLTIIRFSNSDVLSNCDSVVIQIFELTQKL